MTILQHNGRIDNVYVDVDRKHAKIIPRFENEGLVDNTDTKVVVTMPAISVANYKKLKEYCKEYTLFNTHIGYDFYFDDDAFSGPSIHLPAQHPISKEFKNPNSIYCYSEDEFSDFLNDISNDSKDMTFYKAVSGFREIKQKDDRFEYLKNMKLEEHLTEETIKKVFRELRASMQAMSKISNPYDSNIRSRKDALINRYLQIKPRGLDIDVERAVYVRTKDPKTKGDKVHKDDKNNIRFPYRFEVLAIPIKGEGTKSIIISGVNYSTSINNKSYFTSDRYVYGWIHKRTRNFLQAWNIEGIIKCAMAGRDINDNESIPSEKRKQECVIICHLVAPKIGYSNGYGKSSLVLEPFSEAIPEIIEEAILKKDTIKAKIYRAF